MKILNLFAGIGGNRKLWNSHQVLAIEIDPLIANCYLENFPEDEMIIGKVEDFIESIDLNAFDFIWASPPCITHSCTNMFNRPGVPDLNQIYGLIIYLKYSRQKPWLVENVQPWYGPLIQPSFRIDRHYFWANFHVLSKRTARRKFQPERENRLSFTQLRKLYGLTTKALEGLPIERKRQILRNCIPPKVGKYILDGLESYRPLEDYMS